MRINNKQPIGIEEEECEQQQNKRTQEAATSNRPTHEIIMHLWKWTEKSQEKDEIVTSNLKQQTV